MVAPAELIAGKVRVFHHRREQPKSGTDWRDLAKLFLAFPELKTDRGQVRERLEAGGANKALLSTWKELVAIDYLPEDEDAKFGGMVNG